MADDHSVAITLLVLSASGIAYVTIERIRGRLTSFGKIINVPSWILFLCAGVYVYADRTIAPDSYYRDKQVQRLTGSQPASPQPMCDDKEDARRGWVLVKHELYNGGSPRDHGFRATGECLRTLQQVECGMLADAYVMDAKKGVSPYFLMAKSLGFTHYACGNDRPIPIDHFMDNAASAKAPQSAKPKKTKPKRPAKRPVEIETDDPERYIFSP